MAAFAARHHHHQAIPRAGREGLPVAISARNPALINLPIPVPSIPILNPVITPIIAGSNQNANNPPAAPAPTPTPNPQPTSSGGNGGNGGNNGNGGNGGSNGNGGNNGNGANNGSSGNGGGGQDGGGSSGGTDGGGGEGPYDGGSDTTDGSGQTSPSGDSASSSDGTETDGQSSPSESGAHSTTSSGSTLVSDSGDESSGDTASGSGDDASDGSGDGSGSHSGTSGPEAHGAISTGGSKPGSTTRGGISGGPPGTTGTPGPGGIGGTGATGTDGTKGLSKGAVAGIVVVVLLLSLAVGVIVLRRRWTSRRSERRNRWWFARKRNSQTYGDNHNPETVAGGGSGARSARSSFATTYDHSQTPRLTVDLDMPPLPPMAELRGEPLLVNIDSPRGMAPMAMTPLNRSRFSVGTVSSVGSDGQGQYLVVDRNNLLSPEVGTPMSVRPFSPTESFAFPKPPAAGDTSGDMGPHLSRPTSAHTLGRLSLKSPPLSGTPPIPAMLTITTSPSPSGANPFRDPEDDDNNTLIIPVDPFIGPDEPSTPSPINPEFLEVETIKRPFIPSLEDELLVSIGDKVKLLQMFDDGWALVEKTVRIPDSKGKARAERLTEKGLIPIDCFREPGLDLSSFITTKRVSGYSENSHLSGFVAL